MLIETPLPWNELCQAYGLRDASIFASLPRVARTANSATTIIFQSGQQTIANYPPGTIASPPTYSYLYASYIDEPVIIWFYKRVLPTARL